MDVYLSNISGNNQKPTSLLTITTLHYFILLLFISLMILLHVGTIFVLNLQSCDQLQRRPLVYQEALICAITCVIGTVLCLAPYYANNYNLNLNNCYVCPQPTTWVVLQYFCVLLVTAMLRYTTFTVLSTTLTPSFQSNLIISVVGFLLVVLPYRLIVYTFDIQPWTDEPTSQNMVICFAFSVNQACLFGAAYFLLPVYIFSLLIRNPTLRNSFAMQNTGGATSHLRDCRLLVVTLIQWVWIGYRLNEAQLHFFVFLVAMLLLWLLVDGFNNAIIILLAQCGEHVEIWQSSKSKHKKEMLIDMQNTTNHLADYHSVV